MGRDAGENPQLDRSIGLVRLLSQSVATISPGASVVFSLGLVISYSGAATPFSMAISVTTALLIAVSIGQLARHISSAGGFYSYASAAFGDNMGVLVGWVYSALYVIFICMTSIGFSLVFGDFLTFYLHLEVPEGFLSVVLILSILTITYLGIRPSTTVTTTLAVIEVVLLLVVAVLLIVRAGDINSVAFFSPTAWAGPDVGRAIFLGVVFALASMSGFEASVPLAEEARAPRRMMPQAVLLATAMIGVFYLIASYAAVVGWGPERLDSFNTVANPWREMAGELGGFFALLVVLAILNSQIASVQGSFNASSRLLFAMSRNRMLPHALSTIHPSKKTPYVAASAAAGIALVAVFVAKSRFGGGYPAFVFFLTCATVIFLVLYSVVCTAAAVFYVRRRRSEFRVLTHLLVPALALSVLLPALFVSVRDLTYPANLAIPAVLVWMGGGVLVLVALRIRGVDISAEGKRWLSQDVEVDGSSG